jgi:hypothetical protein
MDTPQEHKEEEEAASPFRIEQLFGSRTRARLLGLFLENAERPFFVRELARRVDAQINAVRRELKNLLDIGVVIEVEGSGVAITPEKEGEEEGETGKGENKRFYQADTTFPLFDDLRAVMKKAAVLMNASLIEFLRSKGRLDLLVLTGRFTEVGNIPTDVLVVGEISAEDVQEAITAFEREIGREVNYTYMPREEFDYRSDVGDRFLSSILQGRRVVLVDKTERAV